MLRTSEGIVHSNQLIDRLFSSFSSLDFSSFDFSSFKMMYSIRLIISDIDTTMLRFQIGRNLFKIIKKILK